MQRNSLLDTSKVDWYQLAVQAGQTMPTWNGYWLLCKAGDVYIELVGNEEKAYLKVSDDKHFDAINMFSIKPLYNGCVHYGFQFNLILGRGDFNQWAINVSDILERATLNLTQNKRSK
jgi:hypothetical protein